MAEPLIYISNTQVALSDAPIPSEWIVSGTPVARACELWKSRDRAALSVVWDCTAGEFDWRFGLDEWAHVLEGSVHVRDENGVWSELVPGSMALFRAGAVSRWPVDRYVRKLAVCRLALPPPLGYGLRAYWKLRTLASGAGGGGAPKSGVSPRAA